MLQFYMAHAKRASWQILNVIQTNMLQLIKHFAIVDIALH